MHESRFSRLCLRAARLVLFALCLLPLAAYASNPIHNFPLTPESGGRYDFTNVQVNVQVADVRQYPPAPETAPETAPVRVHKEIITFNLPFGFNKYDITDEMIPVLEQVKMLLQEAAGVKFMISGYADSTGSEVYNQKLSERRAASVKNWFISNGVSATLLKSVGYGETRPKYDNSTKEGRELNRRVELQSQ